MMGVMGEKGGAVGDWEPLFSAASSVALPRASNPVGRVNDGIPTGHEW